MFKQKEEERRRGGVERSTYTRKRGWRPNEVMSVLVMNSSSVSRGEGVGFRLTRKKARGRRNLLGALGNAVNIPRVSLKAGSEGFSPCSMDEVGRILGDVMTNETVKSFKIEELVETFALGPLYHTDS